MKKKCLDFVYSLFLFSEVPFFFSFQWREYHEISLAITEENWTWNWAFKGWFSNFSLAGRFQFIAEITNFLVISETELWDKFRLFSQLLQVNNCLFLRLILVVISSQNSLSIWWMGTQNLFYCIKEVHVISPLTIRLVISSLFSHFNFPPFILFFRHFFLNFLVFY